MCFNPSLREINLQLGGKMEETRTMLQAAMPALRSAKLELRAFRDVSDALVRNISCDERHGAGVGCLRENVT